MFRIGQYAVYPLRPRTEEPGMKKKVRYAAGAVGAAVPAFGLMVPAAAAAAVPAHKPAVSRKTVALHPRILAAASSTSTGAATAGCTGSSEVHTSNGKGKIPNQALTYWWKRNVASHTCIGTVEGKVSNASLQGQTIEFRTRIYLSGHQKVSDVVAGTCYMEGPSGECTAVKASVGVHRWIGGVDVNVCGAWLWATGPFKGNEAFEPVCRSVP